MNEEILILGWSHPSNTVLSLASQLEVALTDSGAKVTVIDIFNAEHIKKLGQYGRNHFEHIYFMGSPPLHLKYASEYLHNYFLGFCYFWVLDPIIYDLEKWPSVWDFMRTLQKTSRLFVLFPDRSYLQFMENFLGDKAIYFPFLVSHENLLSKDCPSIKGFERKDVLVLANLGQELSNYASKDLNVIINDLDPFYLSQKRKLDLVDYVMHNEGTSNIAVAVKNYIGFSDADLLNYRILPLLVAIDASEKRRRRFNIINSLKSVKVDLIGSGWVEALGNRVNINYLDSSIQHNEFSDIFLRYKILLDFSPNWDAGFNDRVINALACGCRVVTTRNSAINDLGEAACLVRPYSPHFPTPEVEIEFFLNEPPIENKLLSSIKQHNWISKFSQMPTM